MSKMTPKREAFIQEYLVDLCATQAAIRAGYAPNNANKIAYELMQKPAIKAAIDVAMAERSKRTGVNQDRVIRELAKIAFVNATDVISMKDATVLENAKPDDTAAIASVKVKETYGDYEGIEREIKLCDKLKALELLGRHFGMFTDNVHLTGNVGVEIIDDIPKDANQS